MDSWNNQLTETFQIWEVDVPHERVWSGTHPNAPYHISNAMAVLSNALWEEVETDHPDDAQEELLALLEAHPNDVVIRATSTCPHCRGPPASTPESAETVDQFKRLRRVGVKLSNHPVAEIGVTFIEDSEHPRFNTRFTVKSKPFTSLLTPQRVRDFLERYNIVYWRYKSKKQVSVEKQMQIDRSVAKHLGKLKRQFEDDTLHPDQQYSCGLDVPRDGVRKIEQRSRELKEIVALYLDAFEEGCNQEAACANI
ncbi:hypothetical protein BBJ28_00016816 [Nothophytophthora sp. Chile5]|nr:hypothetical protein BBJ28_00016816 [Nothophytophthora sp. Chile5]